jgi:hypothetical protein
VPRGFRDASIRHHRVLDELINEYDELPSTARKDLVRHLVLARYRARLPLPLTEADRANVIERNCERSQSFLLS